MINNSMINLNSPAFCSKSKKAEKTEKKDTEEKTQTSEVILKGEQDYDTFSFEDFEKMQRKEERKAKCGLLGGLLVALGLVTAPIAAEMTESEYDHYAYPVRTVTITKEDQNILNKADSLAKFGRDSSVLESKEFQELLDYSKIQHLPQITQRGIKSLSHGTYIPINMNSPKAKETVLKNVKDAQHSIDHLAKCYAEGRMKSPIQSPIEYACDHITSDEILNEVDFSELKFYQKDISFTKGLIRFSTESIRRDDPKAAEKEEKAIKNAQRLVDSIVQKYKIRAQVSGNYDGDEILTKGELAGLLNMQNLEGLPYELRIRIIQKAVEDYEPISLSMVKDQRDVKRANEKVDADSTKAQKKLDEWALRAQDEFFHILHPNQIKVVSPEVRGQI